jgi:uncharacterized protein (TIGR00297 family)
VHHHSRPKCRYHARPANIAVPDHGIGISHSRGVMNGLPARVAVGLAGAATISMAARRAGALSPGGALAATGVGTAVVAGSGIRGGAMLVAFFTSSTLLGRLPTAGPLDQQRGRERDAVQVVANGGVAAVLALLSTWTQMPDRSLLAAGFGGAIATATADTWATEIGSRSRARPRSIRTLRLTRAGASGGVTLAGIAASAMGAALIAGMAPAPFAPVSRRPSMQAIPIALGGFVGALVDSLLGATVQEVRFCDGCAVETEERVHRCGAQSRLRRGVPWCDNDVVNGLATAAGATAAIFLQDAMPTRR